jgi:ligand-binding sensor domain-containing protein
MGSINEISGLYIMNAFRSKYSVRLNVRWLLCLLLIWSATRLGAQTILFNRVFPPPAKSFFHITGMVQDKQGYMWFATKNGLFRYDGYQMVHYKNNPLDPNSLATGELEAITIDSAGMIWIGTFNAGVEKFDPRTGIFTHFRHQPGDITSIRSDSINVIYCDREGMVWLGSNGLDRLDPTTKKVVRYNYDPNDPTSISSDEIRAIYEDRQGQLWIGTGSVYGMHRDNASSGGLNRFDRKTGKFTRYKHDPSDPTTLTNNKVRAIFEDSKGNFWVGTAGDGLHMMDRQSGTFKHFPYDPRHPEKLSRPPLNRSTPYDHITFIHEDITGSIWIGTAESGLNQYDPRTEKITHYESEKDSAGAYTDYTAWWAYTSREGVLWISTLHGNLYRVNPLQVNVPYTRMPGGGVTTIFEDSENSLWFGTRRGGLLQYGANGDLIKRYQYSPAAGNAINNNDISCIAEDSSKNIWIGTFGGGLNLLNRKLGTFTHYKNVPGNNNSLSNNSILSIYVDPSNEIWLATLYGLNHFDKNTGNFRKYIFSPEDKGDVGTNTVTSVLKDRNSKWWAGCWMRGGVKQFEPESGKFKGYLRGASILAMVEDNAGVVWAAGGEGIYRYDRQLDTFYRFEDPIFLTEIVEVRDIVEDDKGNLWIAAANGIYRINAQRNETTLFGKNYGLSGNELYFLAGLKDSKGKLYFGYQDGYYSFFPEELTRGRKGPQLSIHGFQINNQKIGDDPSLNEPFSAVRTIHLQHHQNTFSFEFVGIDYSNPENNHHLFMLENYDADWNLASAERKATYFNVPPGEYVFRVKAVNSYGIWAERSIVIIISPPWWTTWWFRIGAFLLVAGLIYLLMRWRIRRKFRQQLEQSEKEKQFAELKRKTGELEMQALRAQMNPHFVFNSLNAINSFILQKDKTQASEYLTKFSRLVRMILQNSQSTLITLESELDSLKLYLELEALRFDHRFEYKITVPKDLDIEVIKVPPLIIQPYAENAIWHGLMHKEENGHLFVDINEKDNQLVIRIKDDGIGRKQSAAMTSKTATRHKSMGLKITADRIAMLQRSTTQSEPVIINDLENPDGTAAGTEVIIKLPVIYDKSDIG